MKTFSKLLTMVAGLSISSVTGHAQSTELQQLILNIEKLTQLKAILSDMKTGYQIYHQGYGAISNLSKGNFNLHDVYLQGLLSVSPTVKQYGRAAEIISKQIKLVSEYKSAYRRFTKSGSFSATELEYIAKVYSLLFKESLQDLDELSGIVLSGKLRMSEAERIKAIDRLYLGATDKLQFLRYFNRSGLKVAVLRETEKRNISASKKLYGITTK